MKRGGTVVASLLTGCVAEMRRTTQDKDEDKDNDNDNDKDNHNHKGKGKDLFGSS